MEKIPYIECNEKIWKYIKPYLKQWEYDYKNSFMNTSSWEKRKFLVLNRLGRLGHCANFKTHNITEYNRELVTDVEEFLERAAELKGFTYKRKDIMEINEIEIKPGMIIEVQETNGKLTFYIVFPLLNGELGVVSYNGDVYWNDINRFAKDYSSKIVRIHDLASSGFGGLNAGEILWEKPKEVILTMDEIAKKFGVPVEQIKIKK